LVTVLVLIARRPSSLPVILDMWTVVIVSLRFVCFDELNIGERDLIVNKKSEGEFIFIYRV
jgi:hypothetical protein